MTSPPARVPSACQVPMSIDVLDEADRSIAQKHVHAARVPAARRHARAKGREEAARARVRRRDLQKHVLAVDPGRAHEEWELAGRVVDVDGLAQSAWPGRRVVGAAGEKNTSAIGLTTPVVKSASMRSLKNAVFERPSVTRPRTVVALLP